MLNLCKPDSLYNYGMKILCFSTNSRHNEQNLGWHRVGTDIKYEPNHFKRETGRFQKFYYTFTFTYTFESDDD